MPPTDPYTCLPNTLWGWLPILSHRELATLLVVLRETRGWHRDTCELSGAALAISIGRTRKQACTALHELQARGLIILETRRGPAPTRISLPARFPSAPVLDVSETTHLAATNGRETTHLDVSETTHLEGAKLLIWPCSNEHDLKKDLKKATTEVVAAAADVTTAPDRRNGFERELDDTTSQVMALLHLDESTRGAVRLLARQHEDILLAATCANEYHQERYQKHSSLRYLRSWLRREQTSPPPRAPYPLHGATPTRQPDLPTTGPDGPLGPGMPDRYKGLLVASATCLYWNGKQLADRSLVDKLPLPQNGYIDGRWVTPTPERNSSHA